MRAFARALFLSAFACSWPSPVRAGQVTVPLAEHRAIELEFDDQARILFYPQIHDADGATPADLERVALSQYALALFLWKHPDYVVFDEMPGADGLHPRPARFAAAFPDRALPGDFAHCTRDQRRYLVRFGAGPVLRALGRIPAVHACFTPAESEETLRQVEAQSRRTGSLNPEALAIIGEQRERLAAQRVLGFLEANPDRRVLLVFGAEHGFRRHFPGLGFGEFVGMEAINGFHGFGARTAAGAEAKADIRAESKAESKVAGVPAAESQAGAKGSGTGPARPGVDTLEDNHRTPLANAIAARRRDRVRALLAAGADPRFRDASGRRPLAYAVEAGDLAILRALLARLGRADAEEAVTLEEPDLEARGEDGQGPSGVTVLRSYPDLLTLATDLWENGAGNGIDYFPVIQELKAFLSEPEAGKETKR